MGPNDNVCASIPSRYITQKNIKVYIRQRRWIDRFSSLEKTCWSCSTRLFFPAQYKELLTSYGPPLGVGPWTLPSSPYLRAGAGSGPAAGLWGVKRGTRRNLPRRQQDVGLSGFGLIISMDRHARGRRAFAVPPAPLSSLRYHGVVAKLPSCYC